MHHAAHTDSRFGTYAAKLDSNFEENHSYYRGYHNSCYSDRS